MDENEYVKNLIYYALGGEEVYLLARGRLSETDVNSLSFTKPTVILSVKSGERILVMSPIVALGLNVLFLVFIIVGILMVKAYVLYLISGAMHSNKPDLKQRLIEYEKI